ncbi:protein kinase domain-containing protein [Colletotrichum truncatum]|uniref:Protein kinase domain-containing protein n=1 Tax=Colletotrichum truncatum TaxID=5467 RepID=A0ACC3ZBH9_COLTU|nr:protein kinase domain-containing protein [Colletotrichum truncatum]KAF6787822.1 protein kinase domain-containing protein [Colletotrichum truncatum]
MNGAPTSDDGPSIRPIPFCTPPHATGGPTDEMPLKDLLMAAMCPAIPLGADEPPFFLPIDQLHRLVTPDSALRTLQKCMPGTPDSIRNIFASAIFSESREFRKIFAILVLIDRPDAIIKFMELSISDNNLPLEPTTNSLGEQTTIVKSKTTPSCFDLSLAGLNWYDISAFEDVQWKLLAPTFDQLNVDGAPYRFHPKTILPFVWDDDAEPITQAGGHSLVYQVQIHPGHHTFNTCNKVEPRFAVKELHSSNDDAFDREVEALTRFNDCDTNPHIVSLLTAFKRGETPYLVFPWADTDLQSFWSQPGLPKDDQAILTVKQMLGVAEALKAIHYCRAKKTVKNPKPSLTRAVAEEGYHADLKPENILVMDGQWKLADFGLSRFRHPNESKEDRPLGCSPTYRAPEHDVGAFNGQKADIWSLGCVMSVAATWMTLGRKGVQNFRTKRALASAQSHGKVDDSFFEVGRRQGKQSQLKLNSAVSNWINKLHESPTASPLIHDLLDLVESDMLKVNGAERITSDELVSKLRMIHQKCTEDLAYLKPNPRPVKQSRIPINTHHEKPDTQNPRSISVNMVRVPGHPNPIYPTRRTWPKESRQSDNCNVNTDMVNPSMTRSSTVPSVFPGQSAFYQPASNYNQAVGNEFNLGYATSYTESFATAPTYAPVSPSNKRQPGNMCRGQGRTKRQKPNPMTTPSPAMPREASDLGDASPKACPESSSKVLFACPYFKHDQQRYGTKEWTSCGGRGWEIPRLKEHLSRVHRVSGHRCNRCLNIWPSTAGLAEHQRSPDQCENQLEQVDERIDDAQWGGIQDRKRGKSGSIKWTEIYQIIFPSEVPPSPYRDEPIVTLAEFRNFLTSQLQQPLSAQDLLRVQTGISLVDEFEKTSSVPQLTTGSDVPSRTGGQSNSTTMLFDTPSTKDEQSPVIDYAIGDPGLNMTSCLPVGQPAAFHDDFCLFPYGSSGSPLEGMSQDWCSQSFIGQPIALGDSQMGMFPDVPMSFSFS